MRERGGEEGGGGRWMIQTIKGWAGFVWRMIVTCDHVEGNKAKQRNRHRKRKESLDP